jgi:protein involved in polysaccharide export with SLBB domain
MSNVALAQSVTRRGTDPYALPSAPASLAPSVPPALPEDHEQAGIDRELAPPPALDEPVDPERYVCGAGDVLELNFWGLRNFKLRATVDVEGRAFIPKVGYFKLQGKTLSEARRLMRESVARYFPALGFDVTLAEARTFLVQVVNDVARPGSYQARAIERVSTVIARAGGLNLGASKRRVEVRRRDGTTLPADLLLYQLTGDVKHNPFVRDGDVVFVPFEGLAASIDGAVNRPGRYELVDTRDVSELVELAGGLAPTATRQLPLRLVRRTSDDHRDQTLIAFGDGGAVPSAAVQHDDAVTLPTYLELQQAVTVVGAIAGVANDEAQATRRLPFVQGDSVRTLLERVGGIGPLADLSGSYVLRRGDSIPVDLYALTMLRDMSADRPIELGDTLVVPFKRRNILVQGAVFAPGTYPYNPTFRIDQYLALAGGRTRSAQGIEQIRVITPDGGMKPYAEDLKIVPGSSLVVPERNFSRPELVQIFLTAGGLILSGVALVLAAQN